MTVSRRRRRGAGVVRPRQPTPCRPRARGFEATRRGWAFGDRAADDGEGEGLGGGRTDTVRGGDRERVRAAGGRCSRDCRRAVPVVRERDSRRQCARLGQCRRGQPVDVTVKVPAWPTVKVAWSALVIPGAWRAVRVKVWVAAGPTPFVAVIVNRYTPPVDRCSRKCRRAVPVVRERDSRRQCARLGQCARGHPGRRDGKGPGLADGKGGAAGLVIWHAWLTVRVKAWVAAGLTPFVAVIVNGYVPAVVAAGVPEIVAVPSPLSVNVTPGGRRRSSDNAHVGVPVVVTVKVPAWPAVKVVPAGLVIWHAWRTVRVKTWVASGLTPFVAVIVTAYVPPEPAAGVPASVAVPSPLSVNVTPGRQTRRGQCAPGHPSRQRGQRREDNRLAGLAHRKGGGGRAGGGGGRARRRRRARRVDREAEGRRWGR